MSDYAVRVGGERSCALLHPLLAKICPIFRGYTILWLAAIALPSIGCGDGEGTGSPINTAAQGLTVSVDKGDTSVGFARGTTRVTEKTGAFTISKSPVTKKQYKACERAKMCSAPKLEECSDPALAHASFKGADDSAAVCIGRENAEAYCKWAGGRLPTLAEWLRAARGASVQEYPWGSTRASCNQHPKSVEGNPQVRQGQASSVSTEGCASTSEAAILTKKHSAGAALGSGMQDILITPAELLMGHEMSPFSACSKGQHCLVYGLNPGSIDSVKPYRIGSMYAAKPSDEPQLHLAPEAYGFRCVVEK